MAGFHPLDHRTDIGELVRVNDRQTPTYLYNIVTGNAGYAGCVRPERPLVDVP
jgi:hypothetical protein